MSKAGFRKIHSKQPQGLCCGYPPPPITIPEEEDDAPTLSPDHERGDD
jgi:hypothetical protein